MTASSKLSQTSSIAIMLIAMSLIPLGDAGGKLLTQNNVDSFFVAWSRFFIGGICLLPFMRLRLVELPSIFNWRVLLRGVFITGSISCILLALSTEPIANVFATLFLAPIAAYFLAALLLKEKITATRIILLLIGFCGVLMVVKPNLNMSQGMIYALLTSCFYSGYLVSNRWLVGHYRPRFLLISQLFIGSLLLAPIGLSKIPSSFDTHITQLVLLSALGSAVGNLLFIEASRRIPTNVAAPLIYSQLLFATLYGITIFGTWPDTLSQIGLAVIIFSGFASWFIAGKEQ